MSPQPAMTWKGRLIAFGVSALLCIAILEGGARIIDRDRSGIASMTLNLQPYMMFAAHPGKNLTWRNIETKQDIPSRMTFNNLGFMGSLDYTVPPNAAYFETWAKKPGERLIAITGGSVVHGVGATSNDQTIAGQVEATLNARQSTHKYRVINLGMGSWIAYQQFLGLSLFGLPLQPDWVIVMDGHNDAAVACPHGSGPGNPMGWPQMLYLTGGGEGASRGPLLQWALGNSALARVVTGQPASVQGTGRLGEVFFDEADPDKRFLVKMRGLTMRDLDRQVEFYLQAQNNVRQLFSGSNVLFSTQPFLHDNALSPWYRRAYDLEAPAADRQAARATLKKELDDFIAKGGDTKCGHSVSAEALAYFIGRSAMALEGIVPAWTAGSAGRSIRYANTEMVFPQDDPQRVPGFVDNAHMSDLGQRQIAQYFAGFVLETDLQIPFDVAAFARQAQAEARAAAEKLPKP